MAEAPSQRERQRLGRLVAEHAGAWVTAVPSALEGSDCILSPSVFRTAVRYRLGLPVARPDVQCSFCMQPFDLCGDHAACCKKNADIIVRHNRIRNLVARMGDEGLLSPVLEKRGILGDSKRPGRRPGDVTFPCWRDSRGRGAFVSRPRLRSRTCTRRTPLMTTVSGSTRSMMVVLSAPPSASVLWLSRPPVGSARKGFPF